MELFALQFILLLLFYIKLYWILNYMDIVDRKSKNRIVIPIGWIGIR